MGKESDSRAGDKPKREAGDKRTAQLWEAGSGRWVLQLTTWRPRSAAADQFYHLTALPSDWGRGFALVKITDDAERPVYHVNLNSEDPTCDCKGHQRWGRCKHVEALLALQGKGKLDAVQAPAPAAPAPKPKPPAVPVALDDL
jgi:hypothetical protein